MIICEGYMDVIALHQAGLQSFCDKEGLTEINIIKHDGEIWHSSESDYDVATRKKVFNMYNYDQSKPFCSILKENGPETFVQDFRQMADSNKGEVRKYAAIKFSFDADGDPSNGNEEKGMLQFGYNIKNYAKLVKNIANYKNVGQSGSLIVLSISNINDLISDKSLNPELINYETIRKTNFKLEAVSSSNNASLPSDFTPLVEVIKNNNEKDIFTVNLNGTTYYGQCKYNDVHMIVSIISTSEADLSRNISIFVNTFLEIIVFGLFFITIYILVKKLVIDRIEKTNESLAKITAGDLDEVLDGGNVTEFKVLAEDINETVDALKGYIDAANKRIDEELKMAKAIQTAVLPSTFPAFPDRKEFDIYASMHAAKEVGGDFYDFYFSNQEHFHFTIADVSGKGIPAALFMMRAKSILKSLTQTNIPINEAFAKGNNALCEGNEAGMFVTAWSASVDLTNGVLTFANGGHNPPLIKHKNGKFEYLRAPVNLVLAAMDGMPYGINKLQLEIGDIVYLYTDGVTEGVNTKGEQLGEERLQNILNSKDFDSCKELCEYVYDECVKFADGAAQFDDITMVAFRFDGFKK